ncbi:hypothetical protein AB0H51_17500 [Streptomyces griseoluteus]|uniref:hypothetical protein n=1 Tax=Streptomyces griseoluteus TaxID=29306 RepID=UPI003407F4ED
MSEEPRKLLGRVRGAGPTPEARFAKAMDRRQPLLLNWMARGGTWRTPGSPPTTSGPARR